jgi:Flp pilus assembly protein TadD
VATPPPKAGEERSAGSGEAPRRGSLAASGRSSFALGTAIALLAVAPYLGALSCGFTCDDWIVVVENRLLGGPIDVASIFSSNVWGERETVQPKSGTPDRHAPELQGLYRPVTVMSFALERPLWRLNPLGYHVVNVALHALVSWLVFQIAIRVGLSIGGAFFAAALFAVHPIHTEAVTSVVGRAELLATVFFMLALVVAGSGWFVERWHAAVGGIAILYFLGLCAKESAVTLPAVLFGWAASTPFVLRGLGSREQEHARSRKQESQRRLRREPGAAVESGVRAALLGPRWRVLWVGLGLVLAVFLAFRRGAVAQGPHTWPGFDGVSSGNRVLTATRVLMEYVGLLLWPGMLSAEYWTPQVPIARSVMEPAVLASLMLCGALGVAAAACWRHARPVAFGLIWFFVTLLPVSNLFFPIGVAKAERLLYLPSVGFCLAVAGALTLIWPRTRWKGLVPFVLAALLAALGIRTWVRNLDWRDDLTLGLATLRSSPTSPTFNGIVGSEYASRGDYARALPYRELAIREAPGNYMHRYNLGNNLIELGRFDEAERAFTRALELRPGWLDALNNLGQAQIMQGHNDTAVRTLNHLLALDRRGCLEAYSNLGVAHLNLGDAAEAEQVLRQGLALAPNDARLHYNLALSLKALGRMDEAVRERERSSALDPETAEWPF